VKILAHVHGYPPEHGAGAEWMLHHLLAEMVKRGHTCDVIAQPFAESGEIEGVTVYADGGEEARLWGECDVALTHLDRTREAVDLAVEHAKPLVHLVHNPSQLAFWNISRFNCQCAVFNSVWLRERVQWVGQATVVRPPVDAKRYRVKPGAKIALLNVSPEKGSAIFWDLARRMPGHEFLAVDGVYGRQTRPRGGLANVEYIPNQADVRKVYKKTRVLLMPSSFESWGRCAIEAACSGIPTIASPVEGLVESLGMAGIFRPLGNPKAWEEAVRELDGEKVWAEASARALRRSVELDPKPDYDAFETALELAAASSPAVIPPKGYWNGPPRRHGNARRR